MTSRRRDSKHASFSACLIEKKAIFRSELILLSASNLISLGFCKPALAIRPEILAKWRRKGEFGEKQEDDSESR